MVMTRPPAYHPGNFLMKNMNPTNSGLMLLGKSFLIVSWCKQDVQNTYI